MVYGCTLSEWYMDVSIFQSNILYTGMMLFYCCCVKFLRDDAEIIFCKIRLFSTVTAIVDVIGCINGEAN